MNRLRGVAPVVCGAVVVGGACGPRSTAGPSTPPPLAPIAIVVSEQSSTGARLVAISENGDRLFEIVQAALTTVRDVNPTISPDGKWLAFVSSRGRDDGETSLWIAPLAMGALPRPLTDGAGIDSQPTWTPDGTAIVFASTRSADKHFHLWRVELAITDGRPVRRGAPVQLTHEPGYEATPSVAADGSIVYAEVTTPAPGQLASVLERRAPDGTTHTLTAGPADASPALSPDGTTIVFARATVHGKLVDSDLWQLPVVGGEATPVVEVALTDESGPSWSRDGRFVLATSVLRGDQGRVVFSSAIVVDMREVPRVARILEDHAGPTWRLTPAATGAAIDATAMHGNAPYLAELKRIIAEALADQSAPPTVPAP